MIGKRLAHYEILAKIGAGGMGEVYRARDTKLERDVALKILPPQMAQDPDRRMRFEREAKAIAALRHPHIVTIYSVEEVDGYTFLTMELLEGHTLSESIPADGFTLERFLQLAIPIAEAVGFAHARGIVHRDLKPGNVVLEHDRLVKVLDFGLAKTMTGGTENDAATVLGDVVVTGEGRVLGTAAYMAPEQAEGKPTDVRSDVFALGVMFYEMVTGRRPFQGTNEISTLSSILRDTPAAITDVKPTLPRHLGRVVKRCLEKDPERRYETARAVRLDLETLQEELRAGGELGPVPQSTPAAALGSRSDPTGSPSGAPAASGAPASGPYAAVGSPAGPQSVPAAPPASGWGTGSWPGTGPSGAPPSTPGRQRGRGPWLVAVLVLGIAGVLAGAFVVRSRQGRVHAGGATAAAAPAAKTPASTSTIVVFPFENLGPADDTYFAAGITDEIMSRLARVQGLAVLSRTTATQYERKSKTMQQIVADLGVQYVLDGTVRWQRVAGGTSRVRVTPQLIRAGDDTQMWSDSYDRSMEEIFQVQSDIASEVVNKLGLTLLGGDGQSLPDAPTKSVDAYQAYLRGKEILERLTTDTDDWRVAIQMLERAIEYDPEFVRALALLSKTRSGMRHYGWDAGEPNLVKAKAAADQALRIDPDSPWAHMALGYYSYWGHKEYARALEEFAIADRMLPNQSDFLMPLAYIRRRQGRFQEASDGLARVQKLDPRNVELLYTLGETKTILGLYAQADVEFDRAIRIAPDVLVNYLAKALNAMLAGEMDRAHEALTKAPMTSNPEFVAWASTIECNAGRFERALELAAQLPDIHEEQFNLICRPLAQALVYAAMKQPEPAATAFEAARGRLEAHVQANPGSANNHSALALAYAGLGRKEDAVREGTRALDMYPASQDKWIRQCRLLDLVYVHILTGDSEAAIDRLEELLAGPTNQVSVPLLRSSPRFDPLSANPRFERLLQRTS